jgi:RNA polymerase sigma-54 factor
MQQALSFLQMPLMELRELIQMELVQNPVLETEKDESAPSGSEEEAPPAAETEPARKDSAKAAEEEPPDMDENWQEYCKGGEFTPRSDQEKRNYMESLVVKATTLPEHLLIQFKLASPDSRDNDIGEYIIGNLDDNGYLQVPLEEVAKALNRELKDVERVLSFIQTFDPLGVAARNLKECLMIQLRYNGNANPLVMRIVEEHLEDLERRRYPSIAKRLGVSVHQVQKAAEFIARLEPKPGRSLSQGKPQYVTPDVAVKKIGDEYVILINDEEISHLRINSVYKRMLKDPRTQESARIYIKEKLNSALWFMRAVQQRHQTIYKVTEMLVRMQGDFIEKGVEYLKPLTLQQLANEVGIHESTVSRVITNKYIETPQGIFEMRYFFTSSLKNAAGDAGTSSSESVKALIKDFVGGEGPCNPLSDKNLVELLAKRGIEVARRTVAKYREELKILPSNLRRRFEGEKKSGKSDGR